MPRDEHLQLIKEFVVVDTETSGFSALENDLIEVAALRFVNGHPLTSFRSLVRPPRPITARSSKVHHLTDRLVQNAPMWWEIRDDFRQFVGDSLVVAHNAKFDSEFLAGEIPKDRWVCSYRLARQLWPELEEFNNGFLWYELGLHERFFGRLTPHSAWDDAFMTGRIFLEECCTFVREGLGRSVDDLVRLANDPITVLRMPFGKHKDCPISEIPTDYLEWFVRASMATDRPVNFRDDPDLFGSVRNELLRRRNATFSQASVA